MNPITAQAVPFGRVILARISSAITARCWKVKTLRTRAVV